MRLIKIILLFIILLIGNYSFYTPAQTDEEYSLKAAFIYRFTDYIEWANNNLGTDFTIAVLGQSNIISPLNEIAKGRKIKNRNINIKVCQDVNNIGDCDILFIPKDYQANIETITAKINNQPVLIIAEQKDASLQGADINFIVSENKLKFEINLKAALRAGFKISSQLLQHAVLINTD